MSAKQTGFPLVAWLTFGLILLTHTAVVGNLIGKNAQATESLQARLQEHLMDAKTEHISIAEDSKDLAQLKVLVQGCNEKLDTLQSALKNH